MNSIHSEATITSKGQITLPKSIRQALGVAPGERIAFDLVGNQVLVSRVEPSEEHADPAIAGFLALLEQDIAAGRNLGNLPPELASALQAALQTPVDDDDIIGDVEL